MIDPTAHSTSRDRGKRVGIVGCASSKLQRSAPARELYTSQLFRKASAYAQATCDEWYILSALHGLLSPDDVVEPYDVKLGRATPHNLSTDAPPIHTWAKRVCSQLTENLSADAHLVVLAGDQYRTFLYHSNWSHEIPMKGLGIGQQLAWLTHNTPERTQP